MIMFKAANPMRNQDFGAILHSHSRPRDVQLILKMIRVKGN